MQKSKIHLLSTRPLSRLLIDEAALQCIIIDEIPFIDTKVCEQANTIDTINLYLQQSITAIFTSMNAVNAVVMHIKQLPVWKVYCIGNTTKKLVAEHFGKNAVAGTAPNAEELGEVMIRDKVDQAVFFCGDQRRDELPEKLKEHAVAIDEVVVYTTIETPLSVAKKYDGILFFSPSAVQSFFSVNTVDKKCQLFAIGTTTAKAIRQYNQNTVSISPSPGKESMVRQVMKQYSECE